MTAANTGRTIPSMFYVVSEKLAWAMKGTGTIDPKRGRLYGTFATLESAENFIALTKSEDGEIVSRPILARSQMHIVCQ